MDNTPTVTKLLKLLDKPPLMKWANRIGLQGITLDDYYKQSKAKGNSYHNQVEDAIKLNKEIEDPYLRARFHLFFEDREILDSEKDVSCEHWRGRYDIKFKHKNETWLCDFKTNAKGIYLENKLQLVAYSEIEKDVNRIAIVSLPDFIVMPVVMHDRKPYVGILRALSHIFKCKSEI